ncbi:MAG: hypothetical protein FWE24_05015 [Defluviitaleaceae bacterium]|nr:hypothetical protein [Defluviitaleaceae bacterium]
MDNNKQNSGRNKYDEATGLFWGASLFVGALIGLIIGFNGNLHSDWWFAALIGLCSFLACGLVAQGVLALVRKGA